MNLNQDVAAFVLNAPRLEEKISIDRTIDEVVKEIPSIVSGEMTAVQRRLHAL